MWKWIEEIIEYNVVDGCAYPTTSISDILNQWEHKGKEVLEWQIIPLYDQAYSQGHYVCMLVIAKVKQALEEK
jgi:hypothetical protein